ncbi:GumC family protein [Anthocerotibacter panamensis]|uniref:GumC family protein n=1 Tax=Anthocerotibacter panamensis TaxID=2857077 RepID=UPI001C403582|nr:Wzz/FepE/Etk N-terminal domain-containing protein [Anthocerotibacter panamensis]
MKNLTQSQTPALIEEEEGSGISLLDLFIVLAYHKKAILLATLGSVILALGLSFLLPDTYTAETTILPPPKKAAGASALLGSLGGLGDLSGSLGLNDQSKLYVGMLTSRTVADRLIERFKLKVVWDMKTLADTRKALESSTTITAGKDSIIAIEVEDKDPQRVAQLANGYVEELYKLTQTLAVTEASQRRLFFEKQLKIAKEGLANAEVALKKTQEKTGLIEIDNQARVILEAIATLRAQVAAKEVELGAMRTATTTQNPDYIRVQEELKGLKAQQIKLEQSQNKRGDIFVASGKVPEASLEYLRAVRDVKYYEKIFEFTAQQFEVAKIDEARDSSLVQVLDQAIPPEKKSGPKRLQITLVVGLVALILSVFWAFANSAYQQMQANPEQALRLQELRGLLWGSKRGRS